MFLLLFAFVHSELLAGDNPYEILGIPRSATQTEIKAAYKKLTLKYHPDVNKEKDAQEKWIRVNEAHNILIDPDRKARFDKLGKIDKYDFLDEQPENNIFFEGGDKKRTFKELKEDNYEKFINQKGDIMILVYRTVLCDECDMYLNIFDEFNKRFKSAIHCAVVDAAEQIEVTSKIGAEKVPSLVFIKNNNSTRKVISTRAIHNIKDIADFWVEQYPAFIKHIKTEKQLHAFLHNDPTQGHVIQYVRQGDETVMFHILASILGNLFQFAVYSNSSLETVSKYNITMFPEIHIYRNPELPPVRFNEVSQVSANILHYYNPIMFHVDGFTFSRHCSDFCFVRCGNAPYFQAKGLIEVNKSVGWVEKDSQFAKSLKMEEGEWVAIFPEINVYFRVQKRIDDKATLKYFWSDYFKDKVKARDVPPEFGFPLTLDALVTETIRFLQYVFSVLEPAFPIFGLGILSLILNKIIKKYKQNAKKQEKCKKHKE